MRLKVETRVKMGHPIKFAAMGACQILAEVVELAGWPRSGVLSIAN